MGQLGLCRVVDAAAHGAGRTLGQRLRQQSGLCVQKGFVQRIPPGMGLLLGFGGSAVGILRTVGLLCLLVGRALTAPRTIRLEDYAEPVPEAFRMKADITQKDGMLSVDGYACIEGERFEHIDTFVALYPGTGGTALRLPTKMVLSEEAYVAEAWPLASWADLLRAFGNRRCQRGNTACTLPTAPMGIIF